MRASSASTRWWTPSWCRSPTAAFPRRRRTGSWPARAHDSARERAGAALQRGRRRGAHRAGAGGAAPRLARDAHRGGREGAPRPPLAAQPQRRRGAGAAARRRAHLLRPADPPEAARGGARPAQQDPQQAPALAAPRRARGGVAQARLPRHPAGEARAAPVPRFDAVHRSVPPGGGGAGRAHAAAGHAAVLPGPAGSRGRGRGVARAGARSAAAAPRDLPGSELGDQAVARGALRRRCAPSPRRRGPGGSAGQQCRGAPRPAHRARGAGRRRPDRHARLAGSGRVHLALQRLRGKRQRPDAHGARVGGPDAGDLRLDRPGHVRLRRARDALRGSRMRAVLLLRPFALPPGTFPLHAGADRAARLGRARAAPARGPAAATLGMSWPRAALLLVASSSRTGPAEGLISLGREARARGIDARFAGDTVRPGEDLGGHLAHAGVPWEKELRLSRKVRPRDLLHDARLLAEWARSGRFDVLHAAFAHDHHLCLWAASRTRRDDLRVVRAAERAVDVTPGILGHRKWAIRRSDGVVVHSAAYRDRLLAQGLDPERIAVVPAGVDAAWFSPGRAPELRARWGVPEEAPLAGIVARMKPERGHRVLLEAFVKALRQVPEAHLVLVGRGEDEPALRGLAGRLAPARIHFGGYLRGPGLVEAYRALDVAVWLREGNDGACRGVLEAMACGVPVIAGNEGAPAELVRDGEHGRVVDAGDPARIAPALAELLGDLRTARRMGAAATARAEEFTLARAAEETLAFWRRLRALPRIS